MPSALLTILYLETKLLFIIYIALLFILHNLKTKPRSRIILLAIAYVSALKNLLVLNRLVGTWFVVGTLGCRDDCPNI